MSAFCQGCGSKVLSGKKTAQSYPLTKWSKFEPISFPPSATGLEVLKSIQKLIISGPEAHLGPCLHLFFVGEQSHLMTFYAETKMENYEAAIGLVKEALFNVEFSSDRAKTIISKYMNRYCSDVFLVCLFIKFDNYCNIHF